MAGELLFRVVDREAATEFLREEHKRFEPGRAAEAFDELFLDRGNYSLLDPAGPGYVVLDGHAFFSDAPWLYEGHHEFDRVFGEPEAATLIVPNELVAEWKHGLASLPVDGEVARHAADIRDALMALMDTVMSDDRLALTVASLL